MNNAKLSALPGVTAIAPTDVLYGTVGGYSRKISRSVLEASMTRFVPAVTVEAYGAVGDGTTDDTVAIQAALTAHPNEIVFLSAKTYRVTQPLTITGGLCGLGESSVLDYRGTSPALYVGNPAYTPGTPIMPVRSSISNLFLEGYYNLNPNVDGIYVVGANHFVLDQVHVHGFVGGAGIHLANDIVGGLIRDCLVIYNLYGLLATTPVAVPSWITAITVERGEFQANNTGVAVLAVGTQHGFMMGVHFTEVIVEGSTVAEMVLDEVSDISLDNCWIETGPGAAIIIGYVANTPRQALVRGCLFAGDAPFIEVLTGDNIIINENIFQTAATVYKKAIRVHSGSTVVTANNWLGSLMTLREDV